MSRRHAKRQSPRRNAGYQSSVPAWVWLFTGCVLGAFVMFLVYLRGVPPQPSTLTTPSDKPVETETAEDESTPKPRFVFYELLKESEVVVKPDTEEEKALQVAPPPENVEYIVQAGSFRNAEDADRLRAQLILMNLQARVDKKLIGDQTWHRVMVGPFKTRAMASKARGQLATMDLDTIMREQRNDG